MKKSNNLNLAKLVSLNSKLKPLEEAMKCFPQVQCDFIHHFADGIYVRERHAPAGTLIVGHRHRYETISLLIKGRFSTYNEETQEIRNIEAPCIWKTPKFAKRMTYSHTETILVTVHPVSEEEDRDLESLEKKFIIDEEEYLQLVEEKQKCLG